VAREISEAGGSALALPVDVRDVDNVQALVDEVARRLGRLDVLVYNSGAIWWSAVETTPVKRFMLLQQVNPQGLYAAVSAALPHFGKQAWKGRIIVVSPPIYSRFFRGKTAYAIGKVGMSVLTKGLAMDFVRQGRKDMAITSIWPAAVSDNQLLTLLSWMREDAKFLEALLAGCLLTLGKLFKSIESAATQDSTRREPHLVKDLRHPVSLIHFFRRALEPCHSDSRSMAAY
jgi:NAD(P)-dependent dehydrogenase (short-subunit alcohol dehydrogenase family)